MSPHEAQAAAASRSRLLRTMRLLLVVVGLAGLSIVGTAAIVGRLTADGEIPAHVANAIAEVLPDDACVPATDAASQLSSRLAAMPDNQWSVITTDAAKLSPCVMAGVSPTQASVVLIPVAPPEVREAMGDVVDELMERCLDRSEAIALVEAVLDRFHVSNASVRTDGPRAFPIDREREVKAHIAAGCFVYSGSGRGPNGELVYYLTGPET